MKIDRYITRSRIVELKSKTFVGAIHEMLGACPASLFESTHDVIHRQIIERESTMTTCLSSGVAIPHVRLKTKRQPYVFVIGRCPNGLEHEGILEYKELRFVILLLASEKDKSYLNVLSSLARLFHDKLLINRLCQISSLKTLQTQVLQAFSGMVARPGTKSHQLNVLMLKEAEKIARGTKCSFIMLFGDSMMGGHIVPPDTFRNFKTILVTQATTELTQHHENIDDVIVVRSSSNRRLSQLRSAILIGLTRGILKYNDKICCVGGIAQSNQLDTLVVVDVEKEFHQVLTKKKQVLPDGINPEVLERVIGIATELGIDGREGRSVGSLFVIGKPQELAPFIKPLVLNPFHGYKEEDRNILNPFMDETVKEFSSIDGAFVIRGDGVLESAGSLIHAPQYYHQLPGGLGTRHAAAAAISLAAKCIAITVSASSGQIMLFKDGQMVPLYDKS